MKNEKLEIIESNEFQNLFDKSKKLIDSARSNMGQMANAITVLHCPLLSHNVVGCTSRLCGQMKARLFVISSERKVH